MKRIVDTATIDRSNTGFTEHETAQLYNGLDCCLTTEIWEEVNATYASSAAVWSPQYAFTRALQAPYLSMMVRGFAVDAFGRYEEAQAIRARIAALGARFSRLVAGGFGLPDLNYASTKQLKTLFYDLMHLPEQWKSVKGQRHIAVDREALEKLAESYFHATPLINIILAIRDLTKQLEVFECDLDSDGRFRAGYNIVGTETGRPSSSANAFGTGRNAQNIDPSLRHVFQADRGYRLGYVDLEQVEARDVGFITGCLFDDWALLDACESGDFHTANAKRIWPDLPWRGDPKGDRAVADGEFYRGFSYRAMAKIGGHLCLTPDHEVLTPQGWMPIWQKPDQILTFSETESRFEIVKHWTDETYQGSLHSFEGNSISALMTANHRVPYRSDQRHGKIRTKLAKDGPGAFMPLGWGYVGGVEEVPARLIAAFMADGNQKSTNRISFHMKKERKFERLAQLCELYGYDYVRVGDYATINATEFPKRCGAFMFKWTKQCLLDFLDEYKHWDGRISETAVALFSVDKQHLEWLQTFGRILGIGGQIKQSKVESNFSGTAKTYITDYYTLGQNNRQYATGASVKHEVRETQFREGSVVQVLCPTVSTGFFYVRRNGKIFVTGNSNYMGTPWTAARSLKVPIRLMEEFQHRYCRGGAQAAYPSLPRWWAWTISQLQLTGQLSTLFGFRRTFLGRPQDPATHREAIAFQPQGTTAQRMNLGMWRVWRHEPRVELLAQGFDSIVFQFREEEDENEIFAHVLELIRVELRSPSGRRYTVPGEAKVGWNWGDESPRNPDGLRKWHPAKPDLRKRTRWPGMGFGGDTDAMFGFVGGK